ncbi:MAG: small metal-binding protein SmbP [Burkholderiales bacterium]
MNLKSAALAFMVGAVSLFGADTSYAAEQEIHLTQALGYAQDAASEGKNNNATAAAEHARQALRHAEMAETVKPDPHITEAKTHLHQAIEEGDRGQSKVAGEHAQEAVNHLKMAYKEQLTFD